VSPDLLEWVLERVQESSLSRTFVLQHQLERAKDPFEVEAAVSQLILRNLIRSVPVKALGSKATVLVSIEFLRSLCSESLFQVFVETLIVKYPSRSFFSVEQIEDLRKLVEPEMDKNKVVQKLCSFGFLVGAGVDGFMLSIPGMGMFVKKVIDARKQLLTSLKRMPFNRSTLVILKEKKLKKVDVVGLDYILDDMLGSHQLVQFNQDCIQISRD